MSQASLNVPTTGPSPPTTFAGIINGLADALVSKNSGGAAPANFPTSPGGPTAFQDWADTSPGGGLVDEREYDGSSWLNKGAQDQTNHVWMPKVGGGSGTIAAAATTDIGSVRQSYVLVTGAVPGTPITSFGNNALLNIGETRFLRFGSAGILTYNAASMILPGAADLTFNAGDSLQAVYLGGSNWLAYNFRSNVGISGRSTGDMFDRWGSAATGGAVRCNGLTLGNGASGGTERANADTVNLFIFLYVNDTTLTVSGGRTAPGNTRAAAITDFNLNKTITLPSVSLRSPSTRQILTSGTGATYTTPAGCVGLRIKQSGGGGGGGAGNTNNGSTGGTTTFNGIDAAGGGGGGKGDNTAQSGPAGTGGQGGAGSALFRLAGGDAMTGNASSGTANGGSGGVNPFGGAGRGGINQSVGDNAKTNTGGGGGGAGGQSGVNGGGGGGGAGEYAEIVITNPAATYIYTVGAGGNGGAAGNRAGGNGGSGIIIVEEFSGPAFIAL